MADMPKAGQQSAVDLVQPMLEQMKHLDFHQRETLLVDLLLCEICTLPAGERLVTLNRIIAELPDLFSVVETEMRRCLVANARGE